MTTVDKQKVFMSCAKCALPCTKSCKVCGTFYCSKRCQVIDWKEHKQYCCGKASMPIMPHHEFRDGRIISKAMWCGSIRDHKK